jgi:hypothetical protein
VQHLKPVATVLRMAPIAAAVSVPFAAGVLDDDGVVEPNEPMVRGATAMLDELAAQTELLARRRRRSASA